MPADDPAAIVGALRRLVAGELVPPEPGASDAYAYPSVAERLAEVAEEAVAGRASGRPPR